MLRTRRGPALVRLATLVLIAVLASACLSAPETKPTAPKPTPITALDAAKLHIPRISFCDLVPPTAIESAIAGPQAEAQNWGSGSDGPVGETETDVSQEFGCSWTSPDGVVARAWVFAQPITKTFANKVATQSSPKENCRLPKGPAFGDPSQLQICQLGGGVLRVRHAGLFGASWLACEIAAPAVRPKQLRDRADAWCVQIANALDSAH